MSKLHHFLFILFMLLIGCNSVPKPTKKTELYPLNTSTIIPVDTKVKKGTLKNGMTYYIRQNPKPEQKVELRLVVKAGSILETKKQLGLAHFMEHMNFNGSKNFNKNELVDYLQSIGVKFGAHLNAYTSFDETVYILPIPTDSDEKLEKGFQILEDWAFNASLTEEQIDKERGVVLEEYRLGLGAQKRMLKKYLPKLMHNSHYAERLPIGTKKVLENFTYEDLRTFYKDWYRPDLMAIVAVGDISADVLEEKIRNHFGKYPKVKNAKKREEFYTPNHKETLVSIVTDSEATRSSVSMYYKDKTNATPSLNVGDYKKDIKNQLFINMLNNRLNELRNKETPPFIYAGSWYGNTWDKSKKAYQSYAGCSETGQLKALKTLATENERALRFGFLESELKRAKTALKKAHENAFSERTKTESKTYASAYIQNFLTKEPIPGIEWEFEKLKKTLPTITLLECNAIIKNYLHKDNLVIVLSGPKKEKLKKVSEDQVLDIITNVKNANLTAYTETVFKNGLMKSTPKKGTIINIFKDSIVKLTKLTLSNGAKVTYKKTDFKNNQILFSAFSYGGTSLYSDDELKKTNVINNTLAEAGINGYSKNDLTKILADKTVNVAPYINNNSEGLKGSSTPKDLETLFKLSHLYFTKLNYDTKAYNSYMSKLRAYVKNYLSQPFNYFSVELGAFLNQHNPRYQGFPTEAILQQTNYNLAYKKYKERFANAGDFNFYFVGNFNEKKLHEYCETYLANLPSNSQRETFKKHSFKHITGIVDKQINKGNEPKSMVKIMYHGEAHEDSKNESYYLKSLGELLTIKLVEQLREEEGGVYGVRAKGNISKDSEKRYNFNISFPCGPENVDKLVKIAIAEVEKIKTNGVAKKDLTKIKETQLLEYKEALKKNGFWINTIKNADFYNEDVQDILKKEQQIYNLSSKNLQGVAKKYLDKNRVIATLKPE